MTEKRIIVLGTIQVPEVGEVLAFDLPQDIDPAMITEALEKLEADRAAAALAETKKLRAMFLQPPADKKADDTPDDTPEDKPHDG
jgi:hypothetical protein